jgi:hypothetical protein
LTEKLCKSLPAYHAFTGSDYTASFSRRGKVKPIKVLESSTEFQTAFIALAEDPDIKEITFRKIEEFVCCVYGMKKSGSVNAARLDMFANKYKTKKNQRISAVEKLDGSSLPPCFKVLEKKIERACYVSKIWMSSVSSNPPAISLLDYGWKLTAENEYSISWFDGKSCPKILDVVVDNSSTDSDSDNEEISGNVNLYIFILNMTIFKVQDFPITNQKVCKKICNTVAQTNIRKINICFVTFHFIQ